MVVTRNAERTERDEKGELKQDVAVAKKPGPLPGRKLAGKGKKKLAGAKKVKGSAAVAKKSGAVAKTTTTKKRKDSEKASGAKVVGKEKISKASLGVPVPKKAKKVKQTPRGTKSSRLQTEVERLRNELAALKAANAEMQSANADVGPTELANDADGVAVVTPVKKAKKKKAAANEAAVAKAKVGAAAVVSSVKTTGKKKGVAKKAAVVKVAGKGIKKANLKKAPVVSAAVKVVAKGKKKASAKKAAVVSSPLKVGSGCGFRSRMSAPLANSWCNRFFSEAFTCGVILSFIQHPKDNKEAFAATAMKMLNEDLRELEPKLSDELDVHLIVPRKGVDADTPMKQNPSAKGNSKWSWRTMVSIVGEDEIGAESRAAHAARLVKFFNDNCEEDDKGRKSRTIFAGDLTCGRALDSALLDKDVLTLIKAAHPNKSHEYLIGKPEIIQHFWADVTHGEDVLKADVTASGNGSCSATFNPPPESDDEEESEETEETEQPGDNNAEEKVVVETVDESEEADEDAEEDGHGSNDDSVEAEEDDAEAEDENAKISNEEEDDAGADDESFIEADGNGDDDESEASEGDDEDEELEVDEDADEEEEEEE